MTEKVKREENFSEELNAFEFPRDEVVVVSPKLPTKREILVHKIETGVCRYKIKTDVKNILHQYMLLGLRNISQGYYNQLNVSYACNGLKDIYYRVIEAHLSLINLNFQQLNRYYESINSFIESQALWLADYIMQQYPGVSNCPNRNTCARMCLTSQLQSCLNKFEGNILVNPNSQKGMPNNRIGISSNDNSIKSFLYEKLVPIYGTEILKYEYYKDFVNLMMNEYFSKELAFYEITHPIYPDFINVSKAKLYSKLLEAYNDETTSHKEFIDKEFSSNEEFAHFKVLGERYANNLYKPDKCLVLPLRNYSEQAKLIQLSMNKPNYNTKKNYIKIIRTLYTLTNGDISKVQQLSKLMAQIYLGDNVCKHFNIRNSRVALLKTNNAKFLNQFFFGLFNFVFEDPIYGYKTLKDNEIALDSLLHAWNEIGGIQFRNQKLPYKQYRSKKSFYHISKHPIANLINNENVGKFIEDKLYGNIVNVAVESISDGTNLSSFEKLLTADKNTVKRNQSLLGTQSITLNCKYIFITDDEKSEQALSNHNLIDYDFIRLSEEIDEKELIFKDVMYYPISEDTVVRIFEEKEIHRDILAFNQYEKYFMCVDFPLYGLSLLLSEKENEDGEELDLSINSSEAEFLDYFIKNCCDTPDFEKLNYYNSNNMYWSIKEGKKLSGKPKCKEDEVLDLKQGYIIRAELLKSAFAEFYKTVTNHKSSLKVDQTVLPNYITVVQGQKVPKEVIEILHSKGYDCTSNPTTCYLGLGLMAKKDILKKARDLKKKLHQEAPVRPKLDEFADFIFNEIATPELRNSLSDESNKK